METPVVPVRASVAAISMTMGSAARVRCWVWCLPAQYGEHLAWEAASWSECSAASPRAGWEEGLALMAAMVPVVVPVVWAPVMDLNALRGEDLEA